MLNFRELREDEVDFSWSAEDLNKLLRKIVAQSTLILSELGCQTSTIVDGKEPDHAKTF